MATNAEIFHEIKNNVSLLNSTLQMYEFRLPQLALNPQWKETKHLTKHMSEISSFLPMCNLESSFQPSPTDMEAFFRRFLHEFEMLYADDFFLCLSLGEQLPTLSVDEKQLTMALQQIVKNSYEASDFGSKIYMDVYQKESTLYIILKDYGCGFSLNNPEDAFELGYSTKEDHQGVGLTLAYSAISMVNGIMFARNNPSIGASIEIQIPIPHQQTETENPTCEDS